MFPNPRGLRSLTRTDTALTRRVSAVSVRVSDRSPLAFGNIESGEPPIADYGHNQKQASGARPGRTLLIPQEPVRCIDTVSVSVEGSAIEMKHRGAAAA